MVIALIPSADDATAGETLASVSQRLLEGVATHAIFELDGDGRIESWSDAARSLYGHEAAAILDEPVSVLFADDAGPNPDLKDVLTQAKTGPQELEQWNKRADGSVFWATLTLSPLGGDRFDGYAVVSQDTTVRKQYEQMLERQNDRLKEFADIIAHDLRNPLNVIDAQLDVYRQTRDDEHIEIIEETTDRMECLVEDLLRVARQGNVVTDPEPTDLGAVTATAWAGTGKPNREARLVYADVRSVGADPDRLCVLFENLFRNAVEHGGPAVTVRVGPLEQGFYVEDDGPGITAGNRDEVFDHGFTTKASGSGYGLSVVRTITNAHGWDIRAAESETGGARFEITGVEFLE